MDSMQCMNNVFGRPCGYCMACRLNRQREKKIRLCHESESWKDKVFITLTYDDNHLPTNRSLVKRDVQLFLKRFRKAIEPTKIKYFCCGEYGDNTFRPHYHLIIFGIGLKDKVFQNHQYVPGKDVWYVKCDAWDKGYVSLNPVTPARCEYVAKYCVKKVGGPLKEEWYGDRIGEFCLASRGIGLDWCMRHKDMIDKNLTFLQQGRKKIPIPRYYIEKISKVGDLFRAKRCKALDTLARERFKKEVDEQIEAGQKDFVQWTKDKHSARFAHFFKKLQMKGKTNNV